MSAKAYIRKLVRMVDDGTALPFSYGSALSRNNGLMAAEGTDCGFAWLSAE
jgi:hypothetical protein